MEIIIKHYDTIVTVKKDHEYITMDEVFKMVNAALIGVSWMQSQIDDYIVEWADEIKEK
jgi:hypothetical protein